MNFRGNWNFTLNNDAVHIFSSVQLRTLYFKAGLIRLKLFESAISLENYGIEGQNFIPRLIPWSLICTKRLEVM